jgi:5-formyltetrahydrofolate cyclo-ligase
MDKKTARTIYRQKRMALEERDRIKKDDLILIQFQTLQLPVLEWMLSYQPMPMQHEPATELCTRYLQFQHPALEVAYPRTNTKNWEMAAIATNEESEFSVGEYGLLEPASGDIVDPASIDLVLVPLLILDRQGYRVGFGKGCYDKFLANCRPDCIKIGLSYFDPIEIIDDRDEFDVPLDFGVTPDNVYVF